MYTEYENNTFIFVCYSVFMNPLESLFLENTSGMGFNVFHSGLPDFILIAGKQILFIEIKSSNNTQLPYRQHKVMKALHKAGIIVGICFDGDINKIYRFNPGLNRDLRSYFESKNVFKINLGQIIKKYLEDRQEDISLKDKSLEDKLEILALSKGKKSIDLTAEDIFPGKLA